MLFDPLALVAEAEHLARHGVADPLSLVAVDRDALLTTPYHRAANQARELARGAGRHGSCGMGVGETARYALAYPATRRGPGDMTATGTLVRKLALLRDRLALAPSRPRRVTSAATLPPAGGPRRASTGPSPARSPLPATVT